MPIRVSDQDAFAANLQSQCRGGTAIYHPLEFRSHSGRVGDIAFFNSQGKYMWVHNAFHTQVFAFEKSADSGVGLGATELAIVLCGGRRRCG
jgi:hypothetical protein